MNWLQKLLQANKAIVTAAGTALTALTFAHYLPLPGPVGAAIAVLTPILTWLVPNKKS